MTTWTNEAASILTNMKQTVGIQPWKVPTYTTDKGVMFVKNVSGFAEVTLEGDEISDVVARELIAERLESHCS